MFVIPDGITNFFPFVTERSPRTSEFPNTRRVPFEVNEVEKAPEPMVELLEDKLVKLPLVEVTVVELRVVRFATGEKRFPVAEIEGEVIEVEPVMLFPVMVVTLAVVPVKPPAVTFTPVKSAEAVTFKLEVSTVPNVPLPVTLEEPLTERTANDPVPETVIEGEVMAEVATRLDPVTTVPLIFPNTTLELVPILCGKERVTAEFSEPEPETRT